MKPRSSRANPPHPPHINMILAYPATSRRNAPQTSDGVNQGMHTPTASGARKRNAAQPQVLVQPRKRQSATTAATSTDHANRSRAPAPPASRNPQQQQPVNQMTSAMGRQSRPQGSKQPAPRQPASRQGPARQQPTKRAAPKGELPSVFTDLLNEVNGVPSEVNSRKPGGMSAVCHLLNHVQREEARNEIKQRAALPADPIRKRPAAPPAPEMNPPKRQKQESPLPHGGAIKASSPSTATASVKARSRLPKPPPMGPVPQGPMMSIPPELIAMVFEHLPRKDIKAMRQTCGVFRDIYDKEFPIPMTIHFTLHPYGMRELMDAAHDLKKARRVRKLVLEGYEPIGWPEFMGKYGYLSESSAGRAYKRFLGEYRDHVNSYIEQIEKGGWLVEILKKFPNLREVEYVEGCKDAPPVKELPTGGIKRRHAWTETMTPKNDTPAGWEEYSQRLWANRGSERLFGKSGIETDSFCGLVRAVAVLVQRLYDEEEGDTNCCMKIIERRPFSDQPTFWNTHEHFC